MAVAESWSLIPSAVMEIFLIWAGLYGLFRFLHGTRGFGILRGLLFFVILALILMLFLVERFGLFRIRYLFGGGLLLFLIPLVVLFQPEFRRVLIRLGEVPFLRWFFRADSPVLAEVTKAAHRLARAKIGALIAIEQEVGLGAFVEGGVRLDAVVTSDLIVNIFWPNTPLHDGAIVLRGGRIAAAGCLFPITENPEVARGLGTRHRAAIGVTEESDAIVIVVSEERQEVSLAYRGKLSRNLDRENLSSALNELVAEAPGEAWQPSTGT